MDCHITVHVILIFINNKLSRKFINKIIIKIVIPQTFSNKIKNHIGSKWRLSDVEPLGQNLTTI